MFLEWPSTKRFFFVEKTKFHWLPWQLKCQKFEKIYWIINSSETIKKIKKKNVELLIVLTSTTV